MEAVTHNSQKIAFINYLRTFNLSEDEINQIADRAYNSISPDTVREMYEALKGLLSFSEEYGVSERAGFEDWKDVLESSNNAITKAEQELKK